MSTSDEIQSIEVPESGSETAAVAESVGPGEGPAAAAILAAGVGATVLGALTTAAEASTSFADSLAWSDRVGPLSGKTILAVAAWLVSWVILHVALRNNRIGLSRGVLILTGVLVALGVLGTFPTFFDLFGD